MDWTSLIGALAFFTLGGAVVAAIYSKRDTDARKKDPSVPKSTMAKDGDSHGDPKIR